MAAVRDGMDRGATRIGGMDRHTLRDWVRRFNAAWPDGLADNWTAGPKPRLSAEQLGEFFTINEGGPDRAVHGAGDVSISSASSRRGSALNFMSAMSGRS